MNLNDCSNYHEVLKQAKHYYGNDVVLLPSTRATKKYMIYNPYTNRFIHFGGMGYLDYTKYRQLYDLKTADLHRTRYLNRALNIKGVGKIIRILLIFYVYYYCGITNQILQVVRFFM